MEESNKRREDVLNLHRQGGKREGFCGDWKREGDVERVARYCIVICNEVTIVKDLVT